MLTDAAAHACVGYLGPAGTWTHQACLDLYGQDAVLAPFDREALFAAFAAGTIDRLCIPVTSSLAGVTPYMDDVLAMQCGTIVAEHAMQLGYSLLVRPGATLDQVRTVLAHPVALQEVKPWLDTAIPGVARRAAATGGAAAQEVAQAAVMDIAVLAPPVAASIYGLSTLFHGIEHGPHNVTRWWVIGRDMPSPTGHDKTTLQLAAPAHECEQALSAVSGKILARHELPGGIASGAPVQVIALAGHAAQEPLKAFLHANPAFRLLGSYPRKD